MRKARFYSFIPFFGPITMTDSPRFLAEVNNYLDEIDDSGSFQPERLEKLEDYKTEMLGMGFNAPFSALMAATRDELGESGADEWRDLRKQVWEIRYLASLKHFSLNRVRVAAAAHRLAGALRDFGKPERISLLPLGGAYRKMLFEQGGEPAIEAYRKLLAIFEQRKFAVRGASAVIRIVQDGEEVERTVELSAGADAKATAARLFGKGARVQSVTLGKKSRGLIRNFSTKVALFTAAALEGAAEAKAASEAEEAGDARLARYNDILRKNGLTPDVLLTETEQFEKVKEEAARAGFLKKEKGAWEMEEEMAARLLARRRMKRRRAMEKADEIVYRLLLRYYICHNAEGRKAYGAMPGVLAEPDEERLSVLADLQPAHDGGMQMVRAVAAKLEMEKNAPPLPPRAWGPAFVCLRAGLEPSWAAAHLGADESEVRGAMALVKTLMENPGGRAGEFMSELKKRKS